MRVQRATQQRYHLALRTPLATAKGPIDAREGVVVRLVDEDGNVGVGDAAPLPGFSHESLGEVENALRRALAAGGPVAGQPIDTTERVMQLLRDLDWCQRLPAAAHALDQALLDLLARRQGLPLWRLLAPEQQPRDIPVHALVATADDARTAVAAGYSWLKSKVGAVPLEQDERRLRQIHQTLGADGALSADGGQRVGAALRLDANGCWRTVDEALRALERLANLGVHSVEQPLGAADLEGLAQVRARSPVLVAADESVRSEADLRRVIASTAADAVVIKPMMCGGLLAAAKLGQMAAAAGLPVSITTSLESGVGRHGAYQAAAAQPGELWSCGLCSGELLAEDLLAGPSATAGALSPPGPSDDALRSPVAGPVDTHGPVDAAT